MTALTTTPADTTSGGSAAPSWGRRTSLWTLVQVELRKQVDTRAGKGLLIAIVAISAGVVALQLWLNDPASLTWMNLADGASIGQVLLLPLIGIMAATSEWSQRTALTTFTLEPRRTLVNLAKLASALLLGVGVGLATYAAAAVLNLVGIVAFDGNGSWALDRGVALGMVVMMLWVSQGVGFGLALLNTPVAIVAYLALPTVFSIVTAFERLQGLGQWLDLNATTMPLMAWELDGESLARLGTSVAVWIVLPLAFGLWRTGRREVS